MPDEQAVVAPEWSQESVEKAVQTENERLEKAAGEAIEGSKPKPEGVEKVITEERVEKVVPLGALHEERARRKELAGQVQRQEQELALLRQQMAAATTQQQQKVAPDPNDPVAVINYKLDQTQAELQATRQAQERATQESLQRTQLEHFTAAVRVKDAEFSKDHPEAADAINFLKEQTVNQYLASGMTREQATRTMLGDEFNLAAQAMRNGDNPTEIAYNIAVARGYTPAAKKLEMQREGRGASMPSGGQGKGGGTPSLDALLHASGDDFLKATEGDKWPKLFKGK